VGVGTHPAAFSGIAFPLDDARQLRMVVNDRRLFLGMLQPGGGDGRLRRALGSDAQTPALLLPLAVGGHVVAVLCVSDRHGRLAAGVFELQRVAAMAELAMEMLCIKKRIRAV